MNLRTGYVAAGLIVLVAIGIITASLPAFAKQGGGETAGNCLSFPVIWAEGMAKVLRGTFGIVDLNGGWWYWWGTDPDGNPLSCAPDPDDTTKCDDGMPQQATGPEPGAGAVQVYLQQDVNNEWQAESADGSTSPVNVDWIDWGDNLESQDWYTRSKVRTEVVLIKDLTTPMVEYDMKHLYGLGIEEMWGTTGDVLDGSGTQATVYSHCARLTIQKLLVERGDPILADLIWVPGEGWTEPEGYLVDLINPPIYNTAVYEGGDGTGYYSAEINVKGKIIYGYNWDVKKLNEGAGDYRITFSLDETCGAATLNTFFVEGVTRILGIDEGETPIEVAPGSGGVAVIDFYDQVTYIDVRILQKGSS